MAGAWTPYYLRCVARNRVRAWFRKLKRPRYVIGVLAGALYAWFFFIGKMVEANQAGGQSPIAGLADVYGPWGVALLVIVVLVVVLLSGGRREGIPFERAEIAFLVSAPVSRRQILAFRVWRGQTRLLISSAMLGLVALWFGLHYEVGAVLAFVALNAFMLASMAARLFATGVRARGRSRWLAQLPGLAFAGVLAGALLAAYRPYQGGESVLVWLGALFEREPLHAVLVPFHLVGRALFAETLGAALTGLGVLAGSWAVLLVYVLTRNVPFEEASLLASERAAELKAKGLRGFRAWRAGAHESTRARRRRVVGQPFALAPTGPPMLAVIWKNLIAAGRRHTPRRWLTLLAILAALGLIVSWVFPAASPVPLVLAGLLMYVTLFAVIYAMAAVRVDLRRDLPYLALLRAYPLTGRQVLFGEVFAITAIAGAYASLGLVLAACLARGAEFSGELVSLPWSLRLPILLTALVAAYCALFALAAIENLIALFWPGWSRIGNQKRGGFDQFGQNLVGMFIRLSLFSIAVLPSWYAGKAVFGTFVLTRETLPWSILAAVGVGGAMLVGEAVAALLMSAPAYYRFDVARDLGAS